MKNWKEKNNALCDAMLSLLSKSGYEVTRLSPVGNANRLKVLINGVSVTVTVELTLPGIPVYPAPLLTNIVSGFGITRATVGSMSAFTTWLAKFEEKTKKQAFQPQLFA